MEEKDRKILIFSKNIRKILEKAGEKLNEMQEIRMRAGAPLFAIYKNKEYAVTSSGQLEQNAEHGYVVTAEDVRETLNCAAQHSLYAFEEEVRQGFLTVSGGHRIGIAGQVVLNQSRVKIIQPASCLNIRFSHQIKGCANQVLPYLFNEESGEVFHTLFISPPRCGKTTLLRDVIRQISYGNDMLHGKNVGVVDERSEIGACYQGIPQNDVGIRTDILDGCPKAEGMMMLIRSMAPEVVAVDEIGGKSDLEAMRYVMNCGCKILATVHGTSMEDIKKKPGFLTLFEERIFDRYIVLSSKKGAGTIEDICDERGGSLLCG